jgi:hypothetical protein
MRARTYLEIHYLELKSARDSVRGFRVCSFCRKKERACHFARGGRVGWTGRFWALRGGFRGRTFDRAQLPKRW